MELASKVVQELSKIGGADQGVIDSLSKQFLDIVKVLHPLHSIQAT